ncbi:hypothetical protein ACWDZ4_20210 [Streptomyces sp. NPDC003016]
MDTTPEQARFRIAAGWTAGLTGIGAMTGFLLDGPVLAAVCAVGMGGGSALGTFLTRHRTLKIIKKGRERAAELGYADAVGDTVVIGLSAYAYSVFPLSGPDKVAAVEREARRQAAYQLTATEGLPHHVRETAAAALEAIDDGRDPVAAQRALRELMLAVHEQRRRS